MSELRTPWTLPRSWDDSDARFRVSEKGLVGLSKVAFASLWLLVFAIPWEEAVIIPGIGTGVRLMGMLVLGLGVLAVLEKRRVRLPSSGHVIMALFVAWAAVSYLWSTDPEATLSKALTYLQLFVMAWLIWELASRDLEQKSLMQAYVLGTFVSSIDTLYHYVSHQEATYQRYAGAGFNPNDLGLLLALSIPISYHLMIQSKGWLVWVYRLQLFFAGAAILLTASRTGVVASIVALAIVPLTLVRLARLQRIAAILTIAVLVCSGMFFVPLTSWERLSTIPQEFAEGTFNDRTVIWTAGWEIFRTHPFLGVGAGAFGKSLGRGFTEELVAHNTFVSVLVEEGVIGFGLLCALIGVLALSAKEMPLLPQKLWTVSLLVWLVGVSSCSWESYKPTWFLFSLLIGQWASIVQERLMGDHARGPARDWLPILLRGSQL